MANTYTLINSYAATGSVTSINFTSIPSTYTDLLIKISSRVDVAGNYTDWIKIGFNGSTTSFTYHLIEGTGSSVGVFSGSGQLSGVSVGLTATSNTFSNSEIYIPNYTGSSNKSYSVDAVTENNASSANAVFNAGMWSNSAAITSVNLSPNGATNFLQYTTAYLYGIVKS